MAASARPPMTPNALTMMLSASICGTSRGRRAPSATRMPASYTRKFARTKMRLATFAQATSSTSHTAANIAYIMRAPLLRATAGPIGHHVRRSCRVGARILLAELLRRSRARSSAACVAVSPSAQATDASRRRFEIRIAAPRLAHVDGHRNPQRLALRESRIPSGATPMIVRATLLTRTVLPMTSGSSLKRVRHRS